MITFAKTYFLNEAAFTGSRGEGLNASRRRAGVNPREKGTAAFSLLFFVINGNTEMVFNKAQDATKFPRGKNVFKLYEIERL